MNYFDSPTAVLQYAIGWPVFRPAVIRWVRERLMLDEPVRWAWDVRHPIRLWQKYAGLAQTGCVAETLLVYSWPHTIWARFLPLLSANRGHTGTYAWKGPE